jgi:putative DNA primase/helicase
MLLLEAALYYASMGIPVLPCHWIKSDGSCSCGNPKCESQGKHPYSTLVRHGLSDASKDEDVIKTWWTSFPECNLGLKTGKASGFFVVDLDEKPGGSGMMSMKALCPTGESLPDTVRVLTGGGGEQHYFIYPPGVEIKSGSNVFGDEYPYIDIRGDGGYVIAPPSMHRSGRRYEYDVDGDPNDGQKIQAAPAWLIHLLAQTRSKSKFTRVDVRTHSVSEGRTQFKARFNEGSRNTRLTQALGYIHNILPLTQKGMYGIAQSINLDFCNPPLPRDEVELIANSVMTMDRHPGIKEATLLETQIDVEAMNVDHVDMETGESIQYLFTDEGHANRAIRMAGGKIAYVDALGGWGEFNGRIWVFPNTGMKIAHDLIIQVKASLHRRATKLANQIADLSPDDAEGRQTLERKSKENIAQVAKLEGAGTIKNVATLMKNFCHMEHSKFDANHMLINLQNGVLNIATKELRAHSPADYMTKVSPVSFDPDAKCYRFIKFIKWMFLEEPEMVEYIQKLMGYCLTGLTTEQQFFFFHGDGRNGKSTLVNIFRHIMAPYCGSVPASELMLKEQVSPIRHHIAALRGARVAISSEIRAGARLDEAKIKDLTGGDVITADLKGQNAFHFKPTFKLLLIGNHAPSVPSTDFGIWRRLICIPCDATVTDDQVDPHLEETLCKELPGILNWMLEGFAKWQKDGLKPPHVVLEKVEEYKKGEDRIGQWLSEKCIIAPNNQNISATSKQLYESFRDFCRESGFMTAMTINHLSRELDRRGFKPYRTAAAKGRLGIKLRTEFDPLDDPLDMSGYDPFAEE